MINKKLVFIPKGLISVSLKQFKKYSDYCYLDCKDNGYENELNRMKLYNNFFTASPIFLLEAKEFWDEEKQYHNIYFLIKGKEVLIKDLTNRMIFKVHNIMMMYINGAFGL